MTAFYGLYGELRVRKRAEVDEIIDQLSTCPILDVAVDRSDPPRVAVSIDGCGMLAHAAGVEMEGLVKRLGPLTLEPATLISDYEHQEDILIVAATERSAKEALSRNRLEQIMQMMQDLVPADRTRLAVLATGVSS